MNRSVVSTTTEGLGLGTDPARCAVLATEDKPSQKHRFELDPKTPSIRRSDGRTLQLIREEATVLAQLLRHQRKPLASDELLAVLNKTEQDYPLARLNAHLYRLRQKLIMFDGRLVVSHARRMSYYYGGPDIRVVSF